MVGPVLVAPIVGKFNASFVVLCLVIGLGDKNRGIV